MKYLISELVDFEFTNGYVIFIDTDAVEAELTNNIHQRLKLDYLIYNNPGAYANLIINGDLETYLKIVTKYKSLWPEPQI